MAMHEKAEATIPQAEEAQVEAAAQAPSALESAAAGMNYQAGSQLLSPEAQTAARKDKYESKLGGFIGGHLFDLIHEHLSVEKLDEYGKLGLSKLVDLAKLLEKTDAGKMGGLMDEASEVTAAQKMGEVLLGWAQGEAEKWLAGESGQKVLEEINKYSEEHPLVMASSAVGAAIIGAVVLVSQNYDADAFETEFGLGKGLSMSAGADIGPIQDLCLEGANLGMKFHRERFQASIGANWKNEDGVHTYGAQGEATLKTEGGDSHTLKGSVEATSEDKLKASGGYTLTQESGAKASLNGEFEKAKDGAQTVGVSAAYVGAKDKDGQKPFSVSGGAKMVTDAKGEATLDLKGMVEGSGYKLDMLSQGQPGGLNTKGSLTLEDDNNKTVLSGTYNQADGSLGFDLASSIKEGKLSLNQHAGSSGAGLDLAYDGENTDFSAGLGLKDGAATANAGLEHKAGDWTLSSVAELNITDQQLTKLKAELGHTSADETSSWLLSYAREASKKEGSYLTKDQFSLAFSKAVNEVTFNSKATLGLEGGKVANAGLHFDAKSSNIKASLDLALKRNAAEAFDFSSSLKLGSGKSFNGLDLSYGRTWNDSEQGYKHNLGLSAETQFGDLGLRGDASVSTFNGSDFDTDVSLTGAYPIGGNRKLIAGMGYENVNGEDAYKAIAGVQIGDVPLTVTYVPERKEVSFGASVTFDQISNFFKR